MVSSDSIHGSVESKIPSANIEDSDVDIKSQKSRHIDKYKSPFFNSKEKDQEISEESPGGDSSKHKTSRSSCLNISNKAKDGYSEVYKDNFGEYVSSEKHKDSDLKNPEITGDIAEEYLSSHSYSDNEDENISMVKTTNIEKKILNETYYANIFQKDCIYDNNDWDLRAENKKFTNYTNPLYYNDRNYGESKEIEQSNYKNFPTHELSKIMSNTIYHLCDINILKSAEESEDKNYNETSFMLNTNYFIMICFIRYDNSRNKRVFCINEKNIFDEILINISVAMGKSFVKELDKKLQWYKDTADEDENTESKRKTNYESDTCEHAGSMVVGKFHHQMSVEKHISGINMKKSLSEKFRSSLHRNR